MLECGRGITQAKGHPPVSICAKWAGEGGLLLVKNSNITQKGLLIGFLLHFSNLNDNMNAD